MASSVSLGRSRKPKPASRLCRQKEKRPVQAALLFPNFDCGLDAFDVLCLPALGALYDVELNLLTFLQAAKTVGLDGGEVHEYVFTILAADESIALGIVKPLYCSCFHDVAVFLLLKYALELAGYMQITLRQVTL
jgi:hypothetical protein